MENRWTINGIAFDMKTMPTMFHLKEGRRYRLHMRNASMALFDYV